MQSGIIHFIRSITGKMKKFEHDREFCCHQITHLLDVARIAYIKNLEAGLGIDKELIYTAAILHDIGKSFAVHGQDSS